MSKAKPFARAGDAGGVSAAELRRVEAFRRVFAGNGSSEDAEIVLSHLAHVTGYFRRPSYAEWIARTKSPHGFELHSALSNARAEVLQIIMDDLQMGDDALVELQRSARLERIRTARAA
jgi:hypothetical protein